MSGHWDQLVKVFHGNPLGDSIGAARSGPVKLLGTAFLVSQTELLTCKHLFDHVASWRQVYLLGGSLCRGGVVKLPQEPLCHPNLDVAVLRVNPEAGGDESLQLNSTPGRPPQGTALTLVGFQESDQSVNTSNTKIASYDGVYHLLQTDTKINQGMSGGPAILDGKVIGIIRATNAAQTLVAPVSLFLDWLSELNITQAGTAARVSCPMQHHRFRADEFFGRESELTGIENSIRSKFDAGLTLSVWGIYGPGGCGKTAAVAELADRLLRPKNGLRWDSQPFPGGVLWVDLSAEKPEQAAERWLRNFGNDTRGMEEADCLYRFHQEAIERRPLIILDNAQSREQVDILLVKSPEVVSIIATRDARVLPQVSNIRRLGSLTTEDASALLSFSAKSELRAHSDDVSLVCKLCNNLPLFLRIAGSAIGTAIYDSVTEFAAELTERGLDELAFHDKHAATIFDVSWERLSADERELLANLSMFPGSSFGVGFVVALKKVDRRSAQRLLSTLDNASWLLSRGARYSIHDLVRSYVQSKADFSNREMLRRITACWVDWDFLESEILEVGPHELNEQFNRISESDTGRDKTLASWHDFIRQRIHIFSWHPNLFFQQAINETDDNPVQQTAVRRAIGGEAPSQWVEHTNRTRTQDCSSCELVIPARGVVKLIWHPNGRTFFTPWYEGSILQWNASTGMLIAEWKAHSALDEDAKSILSMALSHDGGLAVTGSLDGKIRGWDMLTGECSFTLAKHSAPVAGVQLTRSDANLVSASWDGTLRVWKLDNRECVATHEIPVGDNEVPWLNSLAVSDHGRYAVTGGENGSVVVCDLESGKVAFFSRDDDYPVRDVDINGEGNFAVTASLHGGVRGWHLTSRRSVTRLGTSETIGVVSLSSDGSLAACGCSDGRILVWNPKTAICSAVLTGHRGRIRSLAISPDGLRLASASADNTVRIWGLALQNATETQLDGNESAWSVKSVGLSRADESVVLERFYWRSKASDASATKNVHRGIVLDVSIGRDGQRAVSGGQDSKVGVWDVSSGTLTAFLDGHTSPVACVANSEECRVAASGSVDGTIRIWDLDRLKCISVLDGHKDALSMVAISSDGQRAASVSEGDRTVRLWNLLRMKCQGIYKISPFETGSAERAWASVDPNARFLSWTSYRNMLDLRSSGQNDIIGCFVDDFSCFAQSINERSAVAGTYQGSVYLFQWKCNGAQRR